MSMMKSVLACVCMCVCAHHQACSCHLLLNYVLFLITSTQKCHCLHKFLVQFVDFIASRRTDSFVFLFLVFFALYSETTHLLPSDVFWACLQNPSLLCIQQYGLNIALACPLTPTHTCAPHAHHACAPVQCAPVALHSLCTSTHLCTYPTHIQRQRTLTEYHNTIPSCAKWCIHREG